MLKALTRKPSPAVTPKTEPPVPAPRRKRVKTDPATPKRPFDAGMLQQAHQKLKPIPATAPEPKAASAFEEKLQAAVRRTMDKRRKAIEGESDTAWEVKRLRPRPGWEDFYAGKKLRRKLDGDDY